MEEEENSFSSQNESSEFIRRSLEKYEEMRQRRENYFFDVDALLSIIDHFTDHLEYEKAMEVVRYAHKLHPRTGNFTLKEAHLYALTGRKNEALKLLELVENVSPFDIDVFLIRGNIYNALEKYELAIASFRKALELAEEQKDDVYLSLAITFQNMGDFNQAVDYYKMSLLNNPENETAMEEMVFSLEAGNRMEEGIEFYKRLIDESPYSFMLWYYLGELLTKSGEFEEAIRAYDYTILIKEDFAPAYLDMAQAFAMLERFQEAIDRFKLAFEYCTPDAFTYYSIGECHENLREFVTARDYYLKAVKMAPEMSQAWYGIGVTFEEEYRWYQAVHYIRKALDLESRNPEYWLAMGDCECRLENHESAESCYRQVITLDPGNEEGWIAYSELLSVMNRAMEAFELLAEARNIHQDKDEIIYRQVCCLYQAGYLEDAYGLLAEAASRNISASNIIFEVMPSLEGDSRIQSILYRNGGRL